MIVLSSFYWVEGNNGSRTAAVTPSMTSAEFSSRERCIAAVRFVKQQPKIHTAFCLQK